QRSGVLAESNHPARFILPHHPGENASRGFVDAVRFKMRSELIVDAWLRRNDLIPVTGCMLFAATFQRKRWRSVEQDFLINRRHRRNGRTLRLKLPPGMGLLTL